LVNDKQE